MSARLDTLPRYRRMTAADLDLVTAIESDAYPHPWTRGNFSDSLAAGYHCWIMECGGAIVGYAVVMIAAGEAHLLNLTIVVGSQRRGLGTEFLHFAKKLGRNYGAERMLLEVRPSNASGRALYAREGFREIGQRRGYYPAREGREDAIVLELAL